jgi:hypothetical protein
MALFRRSPIDCPMCESVVETDYQPAVSHFMTHLDDDVRGDPSSGLRLACGCIDAVWPADSDFPTSMMRHLRDRHGVKVKTRT